MFPYYMNMGMSYEEYWQGPVWLTRAYREAYDMRMRQEEWARWRHGLYVYDALLKLAPILRPFSKETKPGQYIDRPFPLTEKEAKEQERQREEENFFAYLKHMEEESERNRKKRLAAEKQEVSNDG